MIDNTKTPYKGLTKPIPGVSEDTWGTYINSSIDLIDAALGGTLTLALATASTTLSATQVKNTGFRFTSTLTTTATVLFPITYRGLAVITNATKQLLTCGYATGTKVTVQANQTVSLWSDGVNFFAVSSGGSQSIVDSPSDSVTYGRKNSAWVPVLPSVGGTLTGTLNITAAGNNLFASTVTTGTITARTLQDRGADRLNVKDYGAALNGVASDAVAMNAVLAALGTNVTDAVVYIPHGVTNYTWASLSNPGPNNPVHWIHDGVLSGTAPVVQVSRANKGDLVENYHLGTKYFCQESSRVDSQGVVRIDYGLDQPGGTPSSVCTPLRINCDDNAGAITSMWGAHVQMHSYANVNATGNWPQNVGVSSSVLRYGKSWIAGMHITMADMSNQASSTGAGLLGMEIGHHANGPDDGGVAGSAGLRYGIHLSQSAQISGANSGLVPCEFAMGYQHDGGGTEAVTKSCFGVTGSQTYQVFDARTGTVPPGYTDPCAALRMDPTQIIDFNGASTTNLSAGWKGPAGNYLQYVKTGAPRLRYMDAAVELWSISDAGVMTLGGTMVSGGMSFGSVVDSAASDTSKHILLYSTTFGIGITSTRMNYVVPATNSHVFLTGTKDTVTITSTGLTLPADPTAALQACTKQYCDNKNFIASQSGAGAPTATLIPAGRASVWKNTTDASVKLYYNDGGTLKSVTLA